MLNNCFIQNFIFCFDLIDKFVRCTAYLELFFQLNTIMLLFLHSNNTDGWTIKYRKGGNICNNSQLDDDEPGCCFASRAGRVLPVLYEVWGGEDGYCGGVSRTELHPDTAPVQPASPPARITISLRGTGGGAGQLRLGSSAPAQCALVQLEIARPVLL